MPEFRTVEILHTYFPSSFLQAGAYQFFIVSSEHMPVGKRGVRPTDAASKIQLVTGWLNELRAANDFKTFG
jgi:hypothetical protein